MAMLIPDKKKMASVIVTRLRDESKPIKEEIGEDRYEDETAAAVRAMTERLMEAFKEGDIASAMQALRDIHDAHHEQPTEEQIESDKENLGIK